MLQVLSASGLMIAATAYTMALCRTSLSNNPRYQYALNYCRAHLHP